MDEEVELAPGDQARAWKEWITGGPPGPIEDDGDEP